MKKILGVLLIAAFLFIGITNVHAYPYIIVEGFVDPTVGVATDNNDGTTTFSQIDYSFIVRWSDPGYAMNYLSLEFTNEAFADMGTISGIDPADWITSTASVPGITRSQLASAGTTLETGDWLTFSMLGTVVKTPALSDPTMWQEGQLWAQSWDAGDTSCCGGDGGSTALVPEPGTLMLLGSGLAGVGFFTRRRKK